MLVRPSGAKAFAAIHFSLGQVESGPLPQSTFMTGAQLLCLSQWINPDN